MTHPENTFMTTELTIPNGHFYSPVVDPADAEVRAHQIWTAQPGHMGFDFNDESHVKVLTDFFPAYISDYDYPEQGPIDSELTHYYTQNSQFSWLDSRLLYVLLRAEPPKRIVEVGSGYSSLLMADVNNRFLKNATEVVCIEPFPRPFLLRGLDGISRVIEKKVQDTEIDIFASLESGDVLFIDSSHVSKTGSDVNFLFFEVFPALAHGVRIHLHDIFLPFDYPMDWVLKHGRSWNEQYLLRAFLMHNYSFDVQFGCAYAWFRHKKLVIDALAHPNGHGFGGGSFWLRKL